MSLIFDRLLYSPLIFLSLLSYSKRSRVPQLIYEQILLAHTVAAARVAALQVEGQAMADIAEAIPYLIGKIHIIFQIVSAHLDDDIGSVYVQNHDNYCLYLLPKLIPDHCNDVMISRADQSNEE